MARERWPKERRSSGANQRALRRSAGCFFLATLIVFSSRALCHPARGLPRADRSEGPLRPQERSLAALGMTPGVRRSSATPASGLHDAGALERPVGISRAHLVAEVDARIADDDVGQRAERDHRQ